MTRVPPESAIMGGDDAGKSRPRGPATSRFPAENAAYRANLYSATEPVSAPRSREHHSQPVGRPDNPAATPSESLTVLAARNNVGASAGNPRRPRYGEFLTPESTPAAHMRSHSAAGPALQPGSYARRYGVNPVAPPISGLHQDHEDGVTSPAYAASDGGVGHSGGLTARGGGTGALSYLAHFTSLLVAEHPLQAHRYEAGAASTGRLLAAPDPPVSVFGPSDQCLGGGASCMSMCLSTGVASTSR